MTTETVCEPQSLQQKILSGSMVLLVGSGMATGINFLYNISVARLLGAQGFGNASAVYTLLILLSAVTLSFQIVSAKVVAQQTSEGAKAAAYRGFHRQAAYCGIVIAFVLFVFQGPIASYLRLPTPILVALLGIGSGFYVPLGARRGYLQGACGFRHLASNLVLEGFFRLCGSLVMMAFGLGVTGVIAANAGALVVAYLFAAPRVKAHGKARMRMPNAFGEAMQAIVFFVGQVVINNCDIVVVKHFFPPAPAGLYAAVALVGRVVFAFSWAVVNTMFPIIAGAKSEERKNHSVLGLSMLLVLGIGTVLTLALRLAPSWLWTLLFGSQFAISGHYGLPYLLALYAATTCIYSLSVVIIAYEMSYRIANTSWLQLAFSVVLIAGIYQFHSSLQEVIWVQMVLMLLLLATVTIQFVYKKFTGPREVSDTLPFTELRRIRQVSEDQVIAEFLHSDFQNPEFERFRVAMDPIVTSPNLQDPSENAKRRALFYIRHGSLWRELPRDTQWYEVSIRPVDYEQIRVFPRAQWRKVAKGNFSLNLVREAISGGRCDKVDPAFLQKIKDINRCIQVQDNPGAVLLIGMHPSGPFTILDGNHRFVAATMAPPGTIQKFHFYCGLSPRMIECCWYETNFSTLVRYGSNLLRGIVHDPEAELTRLLEN